MPSGVEQERGAVDRGKETGVAIEITLRSIDVATSSSVISLLLNATHAVSGSFWSRLSAMRSTSVSCSTTITLINCELNVWSDAAPTTRMPPRNRIEVTVDVFAASVVMAGQVSGLRSHESNRCVGFKPMVVVVTLCVRQQHVCRVTPDNKSGAM
jgi:hypothetical protein